MRMKSLIETYFEAFYHLHNNVSINNRSTTNGEFDLDDTKKPDFIVEYHNGFASFVNKENHVIQVLDYEGYIKSFENCPSFANHRLRCDFIIEDKANQAIILCEVTSTKYGVSGMLKPILNKNKDTVLFAGGKFEKVEDQLLDSLQTLENVPQIREYFNSFLERVCLCSYKLYRDNRVPIQIQRSIDAFNRYLEIEERETGENGAILISEQINKRGFVYKRISHNYSYAIN